MRCVVCGFEAHRDEVPALWAVKRFLEPLFFFLRRVSSVEIE